jgi:hypothetical protein
MRLAIEFFAFLLEDFVANASMFLEHFRIEVTTTIRARVKHHVAGICKGILAKVLTEDTCFILDSRNHLTINVIFIKLSWRSTSRLGPTVALLLVSSSIRISASKRSRRPTTIHSALL